MIERVLLTPDELKAISKGSFIVMKTGTHSMQTRLQLFLNWSITFWEPYTMLERANRAAAHVNRVDLKRNHLKSDKAEEAAEHRDYESSFRFVLRYLQIPSEKMVSAMVIMFCDLICHSTSAGIIAVSTHESMGKSNSLSPAAILYILYTNCLVFMRLSVGFTCFLS